MLAEFSPGEVEREASVKVGEPLRGVETARVFLAVGILLTHGHATVAVAGGRQGPAHGHVEGEAVGWTCRSSHSNPVHVGVVWAHRERRKVNGVVGRGHHLAGGDGLGFSQGAGCLRPPREDVLAFGIQRPTRQEVRPRLCEKNKYNNEQTNKQTKTYCNT